MPWRLPLVARPRTWQKSRMAIVGKRGLSALGLISASLTLVQSADAARIYSAGPTRSCLAASGARFEQHVVEVLNYPEITHRLHVIYGRSSDGRIDYTIDLYFTHDDASAVHLAARLHRFGTSFGFTNAEVNRDEGIWNNVVWTGTVTHPPQTSQLSFVKRCLR